MVQIKEGIFSRMYMGWMIILVILQFSMMESYSQQCTYAIEGKVIDHTTKTPLSYVNVVIQENSHGAITDDNGHFVLDGLCRGSYHISFSHIGCATTDLYLDVHRDTQIVMVLHHHAASLEEIIISEAVDLRDKPSLSVVSRKNIEDQLTANLANMIDNQLGVHMLKNGSHISKPVVQGMYGNRLTILNNGIIQSGQQWGNDHTPEIDPLIADAITIIKGSGALEYGGGHMGNVVLVTPKRISNDPHLHGQVNYAFETNGRGHTVHSRLEKGKETFFWRANATYRSYGDRHSPEYFLNNTGQREWNGAIQMEKKWGTHTALQCYVSTFNTELGILRGSHIGNVTDLYQAFTLSTPLFTESTFDRSISSPKQRVKHQLAKAQITHYINDKSYVDMTAGFQLNDRREFDVRRSGRSDIPALNLIQYTWSKKIKYVYYPSDNNKVTIGNEIRYTDNTNDPETGILPLIPDYISIDNGLFFFHDMRIKDIDINYGIRYDYAYQNAVTIEGGGRPIIQRYSDHFNNLSSHFLTHLEGHNGHSWIFDIGYKMRNPAINERFSNGLHQGVSGIEYGNPLLRIEKGTKATVEYKWQTSNNITLRSQIYGHFFKDFIYLAPSNDVVLTIRGAFPLFTYEQTNARIYGWDMHTDIDFGRQVFGTIKYSYIKGWDSGQNVPLVFIPSSQISSDWTFRPKKSWVVSSHYVVDEVDIELNNRYVLRQNNLLESQDFLETPPAYVLIGFRCAATVIMRSLKYRIQVRIDNLLDVTYRDYLNRQRYFADELGRSVSLSINVKF